MAGREFTGAADVRKVLEEARTVAVLGAHTSPEKPAFYVPDYLASQGYRIVPVNPAFAGKREAWGEPFRARLEDVAEPVDVVDVFRRSEAVIGHVDEILAMRPRPLLVWLQSGIRSDEAASRLLAAGIDVIQDRCMLADHRRFGIDSIG